MNEREKKLALVVGLLAVLTTAFLGWDAVDRRFRDRRRTIASLELQRDELLTTQRKRRQARRRVEAYESRSLPTDLEMARSLYKSWLLGVVAELGFERPHVDSLTERRQGDAFLQLSFRVTGMGSMEQVTRLLHQFYQADQLHRVGQLSLNRVPDRNLVNLDLRADALVLAGAGDAGRLKTTGGNRLQHPDVAAYLEKIAARNPFSPANSPPKIEPIQEQKATQAAEFTLEVKASDPNPADKLTYELEGAPEGAAIDTNSGKLTWVPRQAGRFEFQIVVRDNGTPAETAKLPIVLQVAPAEDPDAAATTLTGLSHGARAVASFVFATSGQRFHLEEGAAFEFGKWKGKVTKIGLRSARIEVDGEELEILGGETLAQAMRRADEAKAAEKARAAAQPGTDPQAGQPDAPASAPDTQPASDNAPADSSPSAEGPADKSSEANATEHSSGEKPAGVKPSEEKPPQEKPLEEKASEEQPAEEKPGETSAAPAQPAAADVPQSTVDSEPVEAAVEPAERDID